jgi:glycerol-1-phosphate dehydrogenase [NAD(P)+]
MLPFNQVGQLPSFFKIGPGLIRNVGREIERAGLDMRSVVIASGRRASCQIADEVERTLPRGAMITRYAITEASEPLVVDLSETCRDVGATLLLSVGGGSVIDVGKRLQRLFNVPNVVIPTIISNDGLVSPISVLRRQNGKRDSYPASVPVGAIIDLSVIKAAPLPYLVAAAGDLLSNLSASQDWLRLDKAQGSAVQFNDLAYHLAFGTAEIVINSSNVDFSDDSFVESLVRCQIFSGLAMSLAGSSRPCSGAEHLISHAIDHLGFVSDVLHGYQVGSISLFVLHLLDQNLDLAIPFARKIGLQLDWRQLSGPLSRRVRETVGCARQVRVGRSTVLDAFTDEQILQECEIFASKLSALVA